MKPFKRNNETHLIYWVEWECHNYENISTNQLLSCTTMQSWINKGSDVHMSRLLTKLLVGSQIPLQPLEKKITVFYYCDECMFVRAVTFWQLEDYVLLLDPTEQVGKKMEKYCIIYYYYYYLFISENHCVHST